MFGKMNVAPVVDLRNTPDEVGRCSDGAVKRLLDVTEHPKIERWIQFPKALFVFLVVPEDPESGAFYVYDRRAMIWFWLDFDDEKFGGYTVSDFDRLVRECRFLDIVERPHILAGKNRWIVEPGLRPQQSGGVAERVMNKPAKRGNDLNPRCFIDSNTNRSKDLGPNPTYLTKTGYRFR